MDEYLIVGLGNPGGQYELTRHNMGFWTVEELAKRWLAKWRSGTQAQLAQKKERFLMKPLTYMNNSGLAVEPFLQKEGIPLQRLLVICDDLDLPAGRIRLRPSGSSGGHRGLASIIACLEREDFPRLRIGIGRPAPGVISAKDWVLAPIQPEEAVLLRSGIQRAASAVEAWLEVGIEKAMTEFNCKA
jgi:PTH1 family peptidyl-tRNA hydrolase